MVQKAVGAESTHRGAQNKPQPEGHANQPHARRTLFGRGNISNVGRGHETEFAPQIPAKTRREMRIQTNPIVPLMPQAMGKEGIRTGRALQVADEHHRTASDAVG